MTLRELFNIYMNLHAKEHCSSWRNMERCYELYLSHWDDRLATSIRKVEIQELHCKLGRSAGKTTANRVVQLLRPMYNRAVFDWELIDCRNPAKGVTLFKLQDRERFFEKAEIERFFKAVATLRYQTTQDFLLMCLLTAARRSNVAAMRWDEISFERAVWRIPKTKNGTSQYLPLVPEAVAILIARKEESKSPWVFPSTRSQAGHLTRPENAWSVILERAGLENARIHDLRRTLGSWQAITGSSLPIIGRTMNHKDAKSTQIYAKLNIDPVRASMELAVRTMREEKTG